MTERYPTVNPEDRPRCIKRDWDVTALNAFGGKGHWVQCSDKAAATKLGGRIIAVDTPFCQKHAREFADDRLTDPEANAR